MMKMLHNFIFIINYISKISPLSIDLSNAYICASISISSTKLQKRFPTNLRIMGRFFVHNFLYCLSYLIAMAFIKIYKYFHPRKPIPFQFVNQQCLESIIRNIDSCFS